VTVAVLLSAGSHGRDPRVLAGLALSTDDLTRAAPAWPCHRPHRPLGATA